MISRLRLEADGKKKLRVIIDAEDVIATMKKSWADAGTDNRGVEYSDVVVDRVELVRTADALRETPGQTMRATVFNCACGTEGCNGLSPVFVTFDGYELHWRVAPYELEASPLEFTFDSKQYLRELDRVARDLRSVSGKTSRAGATRAKAKLRKPARAAKKAGKPVRGAAKTGAAKKAGKPVRGMAQAGKRVRGTPKRGVATRGKPRQSRR